MTVEQTISTRTTSNRPMETPDRDLRYHPLEHVVLARLIP